MMQNLIVGLIVLAAAVYVLRKYLPAALRERLVYRLRRRGTADSRLAAWLDTSSSCGGGCDACKACADPAAPAHSAAAGPAGAEPAPREHVIKIVRR